MANLNADLSQLPSMLWARTLKKRTGKSYGKIQREISPDLKKENPNYWTQSSRAIYKYHQGVRVKNKNFIEKAESFLPGTKRLLTHPLWRILSNPTASNQQLQEYIDDLDLNIRQKLFVYSKVDGAFKRREFKGVREIYYISMLNNIDALACLLILIREFEIKEQADPYIVCKWEACNLLARIGLFSPFKDLVNSIYQYMYPSFIGKNHPLPPSFETFFSIYIPQSFQAPPYTDINFLLEINGLILKAMVNKNIISSNEDEQLKFQFLVDYSGKKRELVRILDNIEFSVPNTKYPEPLNYVMRMMKGDSRHYLSRRSFVYGQKPYLLDD